METSPPPPQHAPYAPHTAGLGGQPTTGLDSPITAVFLVLFAMGAATHMTILQTNLRRGRKFIISGMLFGFCMARIVACTMRLVWASHPRNVSVAIASQIFVAVGVIIFFIVNIIFVQRIYRASHPHLGWARWFSWLFTAYYVVTICVIIILITAVIQSFYTLNMSILAKDKDLLLFGSTYFAVAAFLPIPLLALRAVLPTRGAVREDFGSGRFGSKIAFLLVASAVLTLGAAFRAGTAYVPRPLTNPAWYHSKACFYVFDFTIDISMVIFYAVARVDKRFIIPNGAKGPGDYSRPVVEEKSVEAGNAKVSGEETASAAPTAVVTDVEMGANKEKEGETSAAGAGEGAASEGEAPAAAEPTTEPTTTTAPASTSSPSHDPASEPPASATK